MHVFYHCCVIWLDVLLFRFMVSTARIGKFSGPVWNFKTKNLANQAGLLALLFQREPLTSLCMIWLALFSLYFLRHVLKPLHLPKECNTYTQNINPQTWYEMKTAPTV